MDKYFVIFFVLLTPIVIYIILKPIIKQNKLLNGVVNYDMFMSKFVFRVNSSKEDIIKSLENKNVNDDLHYTFNKDTSIITFEKYNAKISYSLLFESYEEYCILKIEQNSKVIKTNIPYYINLFCINKLNAIPVDFKIHEF